METSKKIQKALESEVTLSDIANLATNRDKKLTYGIIIDVSEPFKFEGKDEYVVKLKIIDHTFNFKAYIGNPEIKFHKFVTVHIYSQFMNKCPKVKNVGDIIRLRRFNFKITDRGEMIGYHNHYSNWLVYKGNKGGKFKHTSAKDFTANNNRTLLPHEKSSLQMLRIWSQTFFQAHSIRYIIWSSDLKEPDAAQVKAGNYICRGVDMILKTAKVLKDKKAVEFVDQRGNQYALFLQAAPVLSKNDVIKLRCVDVLFKKEGRIITLSENSSCLIVPDTFFDAEMFKKGAKISPMVKTPSKITPRRSGKTTPMNTKREATAMYPFLEEFEFEDHLIKPKTKGRKKKKNHQVQKTLIKKSYVHKIPTSVSDLLTILKNPTEHVHQRFVVNANIVGFSQDKLQKIVKKLNPTTKKVLDFNSKVNSKVAMRHIYHFIMFLKDNSVKGQDDMLNIYVLTNEQEQNMFKLWNIVPDPYQSKEWETLTTTEINKFEKKFKSLKDLDNSVKLVVELLQTNAGRPFFKLYDTIFLP